MRGVLLCATCISSAWGDRTFNWAYLGLLVLPFVVVAVVAGVLAWSAGYGPRAIAKRLTARFAAKAPSDIVKETT
ncbi:MAG: hypothetical protein HYU25_03150 [Candidatus Rokubacteria bacterium]|nr:hypothetical protein [Candidatus Rokubacteria bacterium]